MKTSKASSYALHALMYMVRHSTLLPVSNRIIAKSEGIPEGYLAKILQRLVKAQIVVVGKKRGVAYTFARPPEQISVMEVLEAIEGEGFLDDCFMRHCVCEATSDTCIIFSRWREATKQLRESLGQTSLADVTWAHPEHYFRALAKTTPTEAGRQDE